MKKTTFLISSVFAGSLLLLASCNNQPKTGMSETTPAPVPTTIKKAICVLYPTLGNDVKGLVTFTKTDSGIVVIGDLEGLTPGKHGFHIHQYGDLSDPEGKSAGGHYNPDGKKHGGPMSAERHEGDLGNITADANGVAHIEMTDKVIKLNGDHSIIGRGIIVHAGEDDLVTQPTGNAGARVAYGVIGIAKD